MYFFESIKNSTHHINPASVFWWQALNSTITEVIPTLGKIFSGRNIYYPFLSVPVVIHAFTTDFDKFIHYEYNRYSLRKSVYLNSGYRGIWRIDKGDTTYNILKGIEVNHENIKDFILDGYLADKKLIDMKKVETILKKLRFGFHETLPDLIRIYAAEACIRSIIKGES